MWASVGVSYSLSLSHYQVIIILDRAPVAQSAWRLYSKNYNAQHLPLTTSQSSFLKIRAQYPLPACGQARREYILCEFTCSDKVYGMAARKLDKIYYMTNIQNIYKHVTVHGINVAASDQD